ncbi:ribosylnicotinamide kinase [Xylographa carneopallida]|nr:ribosylnicotinamide kinase [Xylographa carneopallida]
MDSGIKGLFGLKGPHPHTTPRSPSRGRARKRSTSPTPNPGATSNPPSKELAIVAAAPTPVRDLAESDEVAVRSKIPHAITKPAPKLANKTRRGLLNDTSAKPLVEKEGLPSSKTLTINDRILEDSPRKSSAIWIGISGAPGSGKTTLAHLLSSIMPSITRVTVVHQDDYQKPRHLLVPGNPADLEQDGEHDQNVDMNGFLRLCRYVNHNGILPPTFRTQHHDVAERAAALALVDSTFIKGLQALMLRSVGIESVSFVIIIEGPFLYHDPELYDALDVKLFLKANLSTARSRRVSRMEHRDLDLNNDVFWLRRDYFDRVIWRLYLKEYNQLFLVSTANKVDSTGNHVDQQIQVQHELNIPIDGTLRWAATILLWEIPRIAILSRPPRLDHYLSSSRTNTQTWLEKIREVIYDAI